jgi:hypothetical protein
VSCTMNEIASTLERNGQRRRRRERPIGKVIHVKPGKDVASQCRSWLVMSRFCKRSFDSRLRSDRCGFYLDALALVEFDQILDALVNRPLGCNVARRLVKLLPDFEKP